MKKNLQLIFKKSFRSAFLGILVLITNVSMAQDYDFIQDENGLVVMEAENYSEKIDTGEDMWDTVTAVPNFSGEGGMRAVLVSVDNYGDASKAFTDSPVLKYNIDFKRTGKHYVWARASHEGGKDDSFHTGINDQEIALSSEMITFEGASGTSMWVWMGWGNKVDEHASVEVPSTGVNTFVVYIREKNFLIDKIILTPDEFYLPYLDNDTLSVGPDETVLGIKNIDNDNFSNLTSYPNPFSEITNLSFNLKASGEIKLTVYNIVGDEVAVLLNNYVTAGKKNIEWAGTDNSNNPLSAGVYFITLKSGTYTETIRTILTR